MVIEQLKMKLGMYDEYDIQCGYGVGCLGYFLHNQLIAVVKCVILESTIMLTQQRKQVKTNVLMIVQCLAYGGYHADYIPTQEDDSVKEYLGMQGKISGKKKQKRHLWRKRDIQKCCEHQAHRKGMRVSRVCAWNTSRLAYDGSGSVCRDWKNHSLCIFQTGKKYNCDLSASYNIGARYFIRELLKPFSVTERPLLEAKVPPVKRRISCVYADLRELYLQLEALKAA